MDRKSVACGENTPVVLLDEIRKSRLTPKVKAFLKSVLGVETGPVLAKCYLKTCPSNLCEPYDFLLYGFDSAAYESKVRQFAQEVVEKYDPAWVISYGLDNPHLVAAFEKLKVPVVVFVDEPLHREECRGYLHNLALAASGIVFLHKEDLGTIGDDHWALAARAFKIVETEGPLEAHLSDPPQDAPRLGIRGLFQTGEKQAEKFSESIKVLRQVADAMLKVISQSDHDLRTILESGRFDRRLYLGPAEQNIADAEAVEMYLHASRLLIPRDRRYAGRLLRRPSAGFNPLIYASDAPDFDESTGEDPLAHFIRAGAPRGRWVHDLISAAAAQSDGARPSSTAKVSAALHAHFHYPELLEGLLDVIGDRHDIELFLTTTSEDGRAQIEEILTRRSVRPESLVIVPNKGRDIGPFLNLLQSGRLDRYDVIGHVHGKKSPEFEKGALWRDFLWNHLIGTNASMADAILSAFAADSTLGLVFAEDPHLSGWEESRDLASSLAARMGIKGPLPNHFEYPMGTMFWARPEALHPLQSLELGDADYPDEPVPVDGTILHAIERLVPFCVRHGGYSYATAYVPNSIR